MPVNRNQKNRQQRAAERLVVALNDERPPSVTWKSADGPQKAQTCLDNLQKKGVVVRSVSE